MAGLTQAQIARQLREEEPDRYGRATDDRWVVNDWTRQATQDPDVPEQETSAATEALQRALKRNAPDYEAPNKGWLGRHGGLEVGGKALISGAMLGLPEMLIPDYFTAQELEDSPNIKTIGDIAGGLATGGGIARYGGKLLGKAGAGLVRRALPYAIPGAIEGASLEAGRQKIEASKGGDRFSDDPLRHLGAMGLAGAGMGVANAVPFVNTGRKALTNALIGGGASGAGLIGGEKLARGEELDPSEFALQIALQAGAGGLMHGGALALGKGGRAISRKVGAGDGTIKTPVTPEQARLDAEEFLGTKPPPAPGTAAAPGGAVPPSAETSRTGVRLSKGDQGIRNYWALMHTLRKAEEEAAQQLAGGTKTIHWGRRFKGQPDYVYGTDQGPMGNDIRYFGKHPETGETTFASASPAHFEGEGKPETVAVMRHEPNKPPGFQDVYKLDPSVPENISSFRNPIPTPEGEILGYVSRPGETYDDFLKMKVPDQDPILIGRHGSDPTVRMITPDELVSSGPMKQAYVLARTQARNELENARNELAKITRREIKNRTIGDLKQDLLDNFDFLERRGHGQGLRALGLGPTTPPAGTQGQAPPPSGPAPSGPPPPRGGGGNGPTGGGGGGLTEAQRAGAARAAAGLGGSPPPPPAAAAAVASPVVPPVVPPAAGGRIAEVEAKIADAKARLQKLKGVQDTGGLDRELNRTLSTLYAEQKNLRQAAKAGTAAVVTPRGTTTPQPYTLTEGTKTLLRKRGVSDEQIKTISREEVNRILKMPVERNPDVGTPPRSAVSKGGPRFVVENLKSGGANVIDTQTGKKLYGASDPASAEARAAEWNAKPPEQSTIQPKTQPAAVPAAPATPPKNMNRLGDKRLNAIISDPKSTDVDRASAQAVLDKRIAKRPAAAAAPIAETPQSQAAARLNAIGDMADKTRNADLPPFLRDDYVGDNPDETVFAWMPTTGKNFENLGQQELANRIGAMRDIVETGRSPDPGIEAALDRTIKIYRTRLKYVSGTPNPANVRTPVKSDMAAMSDQELEALAAMGNERDRGVARRLLEWRENKGASVPKRDLANEAEADAEARIQSAATGESLKGEEIDIDDASLQELNQMLAGMKTPEARQAIQNQIDRVKARGSQKPVNLSGSVNL